MLFWFAQIPAWNKPENDWKKDWKKPEKQKPKEKNDEIVSLDVTGDEVAVESEEEAKEPASGPSQIFKFQTPRFVIVYISNYSPSPFAGSDGRVFPPEPPAWPAGA